MSRPLLSLSTFTPQVGEEVTLFASGLEPGAAYAVVFEGPERTVRERLTADDEGTLEYPFRLEEAGRWRVTVSGPGIRDLHLSLSAAEAQAPPAQPDQGEEAAEPAAAEPATAEEVSTSEGALEAEPGSETGAEMESEATLTPDAPATLAQPATQPASQPATAAEEGASDSTPAAEPESEEVEGERALESPAEPSAAETPVATTPPNLPDTDTGTDTSTGTESPASPDAASESAPGIEQGDEAGGAPQDGLEQSASAAPVEAPADTPAETPSEETATQEAAQEEMPATQPDSPDDRLETSPEPLTTPGATPATAPDATPDTAAPVTATPDTFATEAGALVARSDGRDVWRLDFPPQSGETSGFVEHQGLLYLGHGNSVLAIDPERGVVQRRWLLAGQVTALEPDGDALLISTSTGDGVQQTFTLQDGVVQEPVRFGADPALYGWLRQEADVAEPEARLAQDPTNPWLHLAAARALSPESPRAARHFRAAVDTAQTFYDLAGIARALADLGQLELTGEAMDEALQDFAARGYDPRLLGPDYHRYYHFPLEPFEAALAAEDEAALRFWAPWLEYFATPNAAEVRESLERYAEWLVNADEAQADALRARLAASRPSVVTNALENTALALGRSGWFIALALLVAFVLLHLVLMAKYRRAQQINLERRRLLSKPVSPVSGLMLMRYYSFTEKLVIVLLLVAALFSVALAAWVDRGALDVGTDGALESGTFASADAQRVLRTLVWRGPRGAFIEGYAAQVVEDEETAANRYRAAGEDAGALNNLGVLLRDESYYRRALELEPGFPEARYNLGETTDGFLFERDYRPGEPVLAVPSARDLQLAVVGRWDAAVNAMFRNPWAGLMDARPESVSAPLWTVLVILYLLALLVTVVWLFIPRMRWVAKAPRTVLYHVLAVLVPGSGLADEMWGFLLLVPWAVAGLDALAESLGWPLGYANGLTLFWDLVTLAVVYLVNLVAVIVEYLSYRRRMRALQRDNPSLAREFGLIRD